MKTNWIEKYSTTPAVKKFQDGGAMAPAAPAGPEAGAGAPPAGGGGGDLEAMIQEYAQSRDPQLAVTICDSIVEMMAKQGGGAPGAAPAAPEGAPAGKNGMKLNRGPVFKA